MSDLYSRPALVLTSDPELEKLVSRTLFTLQYRVDSTPIASEAHELANKQDYLLIVVDEPPGRSIDTISFYKKLKLYHPDHEKKVIFISDNKSKTFIEEVTNLGCEHISKPFKPAELALAIEILRTKGIISETRVENRYNWTGECSVDAAGKHTGKTMDISSTGVKMYYEGEKVEEGSKIMVHIPDIGYDGMAIVMWSFTMGEKTLLGLDLETNLNTTTLKKAIPFAS